MKYEISAVSCWNTSSLIKTYGDDLKKFGATLNGGELKLPDFASEDDEDAFNFGSKNKVEIEVNSLEVIRDFIGTFGIIVMTNNSIEIYDDYRE